VVQESGLCAHQAHARAEATADAVGQRLTREEAEQSARVIALGKQLESLRQTEVEAPELQEARNEVNRLVALKGRADEDPETCCG
jgi:hypothetical protein